MGDEEIVRGLRERLLDPRHVAISFAVALLATGLAAGVFGIPSDVLPGATAADARDTEGPPPATLELPVPREGDRGVYNVTVLDASDEDDVRVLDEPRRYLTFEWLEDRTVRDHAGEARFVHQVHDIFHEWSEEERAYTPRTSISQIDARTGEPVSFSYVLEESGDGTESESRTRSIVKPGEQYSSTLCGLLNPFQGEPVALDPDEPVTLFEAPCSLKQFWTEQEAFEPVGTHTIGEHEATMFTREGGVSEVHLWLSPEIPYPLRIAVEDQDEAGVYDVIRLDRFQRGGGPPLDLDGSVDPDPLDPIENGTLHRWGPSEMGIEHPFPLSEAWQLALDDGRVAAFLDEHPSAYVFAADHRRFTVGDEAGEETERRWTIGLGDGDDRIRFRVVERTEPAIHEPPLPRTPVNETQREVRHDNFTHGIPAPRPDAVPDRAPALTSVAEWWEAYRGERYANANLDAWGFRVRCERPSSCEGARVEVSVGTDRIQINDSSIPSQAGSSEVEMSELTVDGAGTAQNVWESTFLRAPDTVQAQTLDEADGGDEDAEVAAALTVPLWTFPEAYAGTIGLVGLLLGLAYWVWPAARYLGLVPLYNRLTRREGLDHDKRREIVALVREEPGIHYAALRRRLDLVDGTAQHHLRKLEELDLVETRTTHGYTCYFPPGEVDQRLMDAAATLKADTARRILAAVRARPGASASEVAEAAGVSPSTAHHHLERLREAGLVDAAREGNALSLDLTETGERALSRFAAA